MNDEIQSLVEQLNAASDAYYNGREEIMTNYEWDAAFDRLKKLEEERKNVFIISFTSAYILTNSGILHFFLYIQLTIHIGHFL